MRMLEIERRQFLFYILARWIQSTFRIITNLKFILTVVFVMLVFGMCWIQNCSSPSCGFKPLKKTERKTSQPSNSPSERVIFNCHNYEYYPWLLLHFSYITKEARKTRQLWRILGIQEAAYQFGGFANRFQSNMLKTFHMKATVVSASPRFIVFKCFSILEKAQMLSCKKKL